MNTNELSLENKITRSTITTLDFRDSKMSDIPTDIEKFHGAHILILNANQMSQLPVELNTLSDLHTVVCLDPDHQFHKIRLGGLYKNRQNEEDFSKEPGAPEDVELFEQITPDSFETQVLTSFHNYMLSNTRNLTGALYDRHVEELRKILEASSEGAQSTSDQLRNFTNILTSPPSTPLKRFIEAHVLDKS